MKQEITITFEHGRWCIRGSHKPTRQRTSLELSVLRLLKYFKHIQRKHAWMKRKGALNKNTWMEVFSK